MRALTEEWVIKAEHDYDTAVIALEHAEYPITDTACFHCQQCAEKYLKGFLQEHDVEFPFRHPLLPLLDLCLTVDSAFETLRDDLRRLDDYAIAVRYPGVTVSVELAQAAIAAATRVRNFVRGKLGLTD